MTHEAGVGQQHETQTVDTYVSNQPINEMLEDAQRIEGSGSPGSVNVQTLPKWLQIFFFSVMVLFVFMVVIGIISSFLK